MAAAFALAAPEQTLGQPVQAGATQPANQNQQQPALSFDIRTLRKEMGLPEGNGPFITIPDKAKRNPASPDYELYHVTIDASLLQKQQLSEEEIAQVEKDRGIKISAWPVTQVRETVAFIAQFNIEIYMTLEQMREHIDMYLYNERR